MVDLVRISQVDLRVTDAGRSREYYERITGRSDLPLTLLDDGVRGPAGRAAGLFHVAYRFATREALGAALRRVAGELSGASDHGVSEALYLRDGDGNGVELYWDRPREQWPQRPDGGIDIYTVPLDLHDLLAAAGDSATVDIGHVHLQASELESSARFWTDAVGLERVVSIPGQAEFLAVDGYHHHVAVNVWVAKGQPPAGPDVAGLERVELADFGPPRTLTTPEQIRVQIT